MQEIYNADECARARKKLSKIVFNNLGKFRRRNVSLPYVMEGDDGQYRVEDFPKPNVTLTSEAETPDPYADHYVYDENEVENPDPNTDHYVNNENEVENPDPNTDHCINNENEVENPDPNSDHCVNNENEVENPDPNTDHYVNNENKVENPYPNTDHCVNNENEVENPDPNTYHCVSNKNEGTRKKTERSTNRSWYWCVDRKGSQGCKYNLRKKIKYDSVVFSAGTSENELNYHDWYKHRKLSARKTEMRPDILNVIKLIKDKKLRISKTKLSENGEETSNNDKKLNWPNGLINFIHL